MMKNYVEKPVTLPDSTWRALDRLLESGPPEADFQMMVESMIAALTWITDSRDAAVAFRKWIDGLGNRDLARVFSLKDPRHGRHPKGAA